jgi:hypothetical protein
VGHEIGVPMKTMVYDFPVVSGLFDGRSLESQW